MTRCSILGIKEVVQFAFNNLASLEKISLLVCLFGLGYPR